MVLYGKTLLQHEPQATTDLLIDLCSGNLGKQRVIPIQHPTSDKDTNESSGPAVLSYLGYNRVQGLFTNDTQNASHTGAKVPNGQSTIGKGDSNANQGTATRIPRAEVDGSINELSDKAAYIPPSPQLFFAHFLDNHDLFVQFLECVANDLWGQKVDPVDPQRSTPLPLRGAGSFDEVDNSVPADQRAVWNTLLELYLASTRSSDLQTSSVARDKAFGLLAQGSSNPYDPIHALMLCSMSGFTEGMVGLWESMGMYEDVLRFFMEKDSMSSSSETSHSIDNTPSPSDEVMRYIHLYGPTNPHLYPLVLRYLTSSPSILSRHSTHLVKLLETIDAEHIMPPLAVVQLLSRNGVTSVGSVKEWLKVKVAETRQDVESDRSLVESYRTETKVKQKEISDLANPRQPEIFQVTRCAACGGQLDLPSVHFMCKHSYHQRCLSDSEPECILCSRQHSIIREVRRNQTRLADRHDLFLNEVQEAEDGFGVVAGAFGRGLMTSNSQGEA